MAFIIIGAMLIMPMMDYAMSVTRSGTAQKDKVARAEAVKAGFRIVMENPSHLYSKCSDPYDIHTPKTLATPPLEIPVQTTCTNIKASQETLESDLRVAMTTTQFGSTAPPFTVGTPYDSSADTNEVAWTGHTSPTSEGGKILLPKLPAHALTHPSPAGYLMPSWAGDCRVFFPGTYNDPITLDGNTPVYFTSGIYYFDDTITVSGSADVVVGGGAIEGCTTDQDGAFNAQGAPSPHNITGYGATWIFGGEGRLVFTDSTPGSGPRMQFNSRLVNDTDIASLASRSVSILSVNGVNGGVSAIDLSVPGNVYVPFSVLDVTGPMNNAMDGGYLPSTLHPDALATPYLPIIDVSLTGANPATLWIPGYVAVPQGDINISVAPGMSAGKDIQLVGGVLAHNFTHTVDLPETIQAGIVNRVVQMTFKLVSKTASSIGPPQVVSTAIVQINDYGDYVVNAWEISVADG